MVKPTVTPRRVTVVIVGPLSRVVALLAILGAQTASAQPGGNDRDRSAALNQQAELAFEQGDFRSAVQLLELAYKAYPEPTILYNLGQTHERLGDSRAALAAYRRYLEAAPDAKDRDAVVALIKRLEAKVATEPAPRVEPTPTTEPPRDREPAPDVRPPPEASVRRGASPWPWVTVGIGGAVAGTGLVFGYLTSRENDRAEAAADQVAAARHVDRAERNATLQLVGVISGGVLVVGGVIWAVLDRRAVQRDARWTVNVGPGSVSARFAF
ncbi:MAG: tetratricopeptide repeat protein [Kofleriaceae bacterium]